MKMFSNPMTMKKHIIILLAAFAAVFAGCTKEIAPENNGNTVPEGSKFTITLSPVTRTVNDGLSTRWTEGDKVGVFHAVSGTENYVSDGAFTFVEGQEFEGSLNETLQAGAEYDWYVVYPYDEKSTSPKAVQITIPADQYQAADGSMAHLSGETCPLAGKTLGLSAGAPVSVTMNHLTTVMKLTVTNYEQNPINLSLVSFRADGCSHETETVTIINGDAQTITGSFKVDITGKKMAYTQVDIGRGSGSSRPLLHLNTPKTLGLNESATVYLATIPFTVANATSTTIGMNKNDGGVKQSIYGKHINCKAGQIYTLRQGSRLAPPFKDGINFYHGQKNADGSYTFQDGWWRCDLPSDFQFSGEFEFKDLFYTCNTGDAKISMLDANNQNDRGGNGNSTRYNELSACCQGFKWVANRRWDNNFNVTYGDKSGLFLNCYAGYNVGSWIIWFRLQDPFIDKLTPSNGVNRLTNSRFDFYYLYNDEHMLTRIGYVTGGSNIARDIHINIQYNTATNDYSGGKLATFKNAWMVQDHLVASDGRVLITNDLASNHFSLTEEGAKYCKQSKGLYWIPAAYTEFASATNPGEYEKRADPESRSQEANLAAELEAFGITMTEDGHIMLGSNYNTSKAFCITPRIKFEYDYGTIVYTYGSRYLPGLCLNI